MDPHKQININLDQTLNDKEHSKIESEIIDDYKKLNEKCDTVINKIKTRKSKTKK